MIHHADTALKESWRKTFDSLPVDSRAALREALVELRRDAAKRAQYCWRQNKGPMALYWKVVSVYSGHIARALRPPKAVAA